MPACAAKKGASVAIPDDWVGKSVLLAPEGANRRIRGELAEVSERGIVLTGDFGKSSAPRTLFCPWRVVRTIELDEDPSEP